MELRGGVPWDVLEGGRDASSSRRACVAPVASARPAASAESKAFGSMVPGGGPPVTSHVFMQLAQRDQTSNLGGAEALLLQVVDGDARDEELRQRTLAIVPVALALYGDNHPKGQKGQKSTPWG